MSGEASVMAGVDNEKAVSAALKDPSTEMPPGARRMTEIERAVRIDAIVEALTKQGMVKEDMPAQQSQAMEQFVKEGIAFEMNINTPKGFALIKVANMTNPEVAATTRRNETTAVTSA
mmetsp:Transcript_22017/g.35309  ORF Transcript_22017/g.35309 Transcript_22017/m.35309 type:complete len:118 (+) Transcript_22017:69-422(+)